MNHVERTAVVVEQFVCVVQTLEHLGDDPQSHAERQRLCGLLGQATQDSMQRLPVEELQRHVRDRPLLPNLEGLHDVGMVQSCGQPRLVHEHRQRLGLVEQRGSQLLEHEQLVDPGRTRDEREVDIGHAAMPDRKQ